MDILNRIEELRIAKGWSMYKLCNEADLTPSTITNMFSRGTYPSIPTLINICNALEISLSDFFGENNSNFSEEEYLLIKDYRKLNKKQKSAIKQLIISITKPE